MEGQGKAEKPRRAAIKILQCNNELCQYELRQVRHTSMSVVCRARALSLSSLVLRSRVCAETRNPRQDGDIESVTQSKRVVKIKLETAPKLILIIKKPNGIAVLGLGVLCEVWGDNAHSYIENAPWERPALCTHAQTRCTMRYAALHFDSKL